MRQDEIKFNRYCAEVMGYKTAKELDYICTWSDDIRGWIKYSPYNDLNQMAKVVEKLLPDYFYSSELSKFVFERNGIKQAFRDFIISTMETEK